MAQNNKILRIEELVLYFNTTHGPVQAVDGVNFELASNRGLSFLVNQGVAKAPSQRLFCASCLATRGPILDVCIWMEKMLCR